MIRRICKWRIQLNQKFFLSLAKKFGDTKVMCTATKTGKPLQKSASKRVLQKTAEARGNLNGNKIINEITLVGKSKRNIIEPQQNKTNEINRKNKFGEIYILPEKCQQVID